MKNTVLVDASKCTGCRGCQVACKNWNQLPAELTQFTGNYENPPSLLPYTWCRVSFTEVPDKNTVAWHFAKLQCMHCKDPVCIKVCPHEAMSRTDLGTIARDWKRCKGCKTCEYLCPYQVPKIGSRSNKMFKCTLCYDRIKKDKQPACVAACPAGALNFGAEDEMLALAKKRVDQLKKAGASKSLIYGEGNRVIYVLKGEPATYKIKEQPLLSTDIYAPVDVLRDEIKKCTDIPLIKAN